MDPRRIGVHGVSQLMITMGVFDMPQDNLQRSLLDRLLDDDPSQPMEPAHQRQVSFAEIRAAVIRDIENLLNTRRVARAVPESLSQVGHSLYVYGLRDFSNENPGSAQVLQRLRREVVQALNLFEPRLKNVVVQVDNRTGDNNLHFRISATLVITPLSEPVVFDTLFDASRGEYVITQ